MPQTKAVFVSYSHQDDAFVKDLVQALEAKAVGETVDYNTLRLGDRIDEFIQTAVKATEWTILVVSENSIRSPWVMAEFLETILYERVEKNKRLLPVNIDQQLFRLDLPLELDEEIQGKIDEVNGYIQKALDINMDIDYYTSIRRRLLDLKINVPKAIERLTSVLVGDFTEEEAFDRNVRALLGAVLDSSSD